MKSLLTVFYIQDALVANLLDKYFNNHSSVNMKIFTEKEHLNMFLIDNHCSLIIFDIGDNIIEAKNYLHFFKARHPNISVILFDSMLLKSDALQLTFELKCQGFLHKGCNVDHIEEGIKNVLNGTNYYSPLLQSYLQGRYMNTSMELNKYDLSSLTKQEKVILKKIAEGASEKLIASELFVSMSTIKVHKNNISVKLGIKGKEKLSYVAYQIKDTIL